VPNPVPVQVIQLGMELWGHTLNAEFTRLAPKVFDVSLDEMERIVIDQMLRIYNFDKKRVSKILKIGTSTLYNKKLKRFGLQNSN
jgi:DNA-binding NtrC family response regulator